MFDVHMDDSIVQKEGSKSGQKQDNDAENFLFSTLQMFNISHLHQMLH